MKAASYTWKIFYKSFEPGQEGLRETLCTLGNGYVGVRGSAPECTASGMHYPGTYISGVYNRLKTRIAGRTVTNEDMVNCPNWTFLTFKIEEGEWFSLSKSNIVSFYQELDIKRALLYRKILIQDWLGQRTLIQSLRIVHMDNPHCLAMKYIITPQNYSKRITVKTMLDGSVRNSGVERYRKLNSQHLKPHRLGSEEKNITYLSMTTTQSKIKISEASKVRIFSSRGEIRPVRKMFTLNKKIIGEELAFFVQRGRTCQIEKTAAIYTSQDRGVKNPLSSAIDLVKTSARFNLLLRKHIKSWHKLWETADVEVEGSTFSEKILRLNIFHLLQTGSPHTSRLDAGLPARGLHGEAYRGHIFWDSIFVMPFYELHLPEVAKSALLYRYRRLQQARVYARREGYRGAMFPWQSASSGEEETQTIHLNPLSGTWGPDYSRLQRHVSFAVAYNAWCYWERVRDIDFLVHHGAEIILAIAQLGASLVYFNRRDGRYHTKGIMGPDEFHEKYPHKSSPGLKDNAYTNFMIIWTIMKAQEVMNLLPPRQRVRILKRLGVKEQELKHWGNITKKMNIIFTPQGIISQFQGYFKLKELDLDKYRARYKNIQRLDRILKAEGRSPDGYRISKQADVLMIFYLHSLKETRRIFKGLGYNFDRDVMRENYEYYFKRTTHGSTLSRVAHCLIAHRLGKHQEAWRLFQEVLESDFYDIQSGTTAEGIHLGVMGGALDIVMRGFLGMRIEEDRVCLSPKLPRSWRRLKLKFCLRGNGISISAGKHSVGALLYERKKGASPIMLEVGGKVYRLPLRRGVKISLKRPRGSNNYPP